MAQQWFYKVMGQQFGPISSQELRNLAQQGMISSYMCRILLIFIIALAIQLLPVKQGFGVEGPSANNSPSASNPSAVLEKKIYQSVKDLEYSDQVAQDFVKMVRPWKCDVLYQKISQAAQDVKQKKISWNQYAQVEEEVVNQLAQTIQREITSADSNSKYFDLALVVKDNKAQCLGYTQLFYILGNSMGLTIQAIDAVEHSKGLQSVGEGHAACAVGLHNGKAMQVDLTLKDCASKTFLFTEEYGKAGNYWELKDKNNRQNIHPRIQLLDRNGLIASIYINRGSADGKSGQPDKAIAEYTKAIELNPKYAEAYTGRGATYDNSGQLDKAISDCTKAIELNPKYAEAYFNRGGAYAKSGKLTEAISDLNKAIELNPKYAEAYYNRGNAYDDSGQFDKAISDFNKAIELNPKYTNAYNNRGIAYGKSGQPDKAIADCTKAIELNPKYAEAYFGRGLAYTSLGKKEYAKKDLRKAIQLNPGLKEVIKKIADQFKLDL